jgi:hypothetical protein
MLRHVSIGKLFRQIVWLFGQIICRNSNNLPTVSNFGSFFIAAAMKMFFKSKIHSALYQNATLKINIDTRRYQHTTVFVTHTTTLEGQPYCDGQSLRFGVFFIQAAMKTPLTFISEWYFDTSRYENTTVIYQ